MAQNKLWRRSFWDAHALAFPEGVLHEDIPVVIPAHFHARSVDVLSKPVYLYRVREGEGEPSITQRRAELRTLTDRFDAVERTRAFLVRHGPYGSRRWYDECAVAEDLRYHLDVLPEGDDAYRDAFLRRATAYLDRAGPGVEARCRRSSGASGSSCATGGCRSCSSCWSTSGPPRSRSTAASVARHRASQVGTRCCGRRGRRAAPISACRARTAASRAGRGASRSPPCRGTSGASRFIGRRVTRIACWRVYLRMPAAPWRTPRPDSFQPPIGSS